MVFPLRVTFTLPLPTAVEPEVVALVIFITSAEVSVASRISLSLAFLSAGMATSVPEGKLVPSAAPPGVPLPTIHLATPVLFTRVGRAMPVVVLYLM